MIKLLTKLLLTPLLLWLAVRGNPADCCGNEQTCADCTDVQKLGLDKKGEIV